MTTPYQGIATEFPPEKIVDNARSVIANALEKSGEYLVVLDDDPTGCQTVHGVPVVLDWNLSVLKQVIAEHNFFYILTNTRAMDADSAKAVLEDVFENLFQLLPKEKLE